LDSTKVAESVYRRAARTAAKSTGLRERYLAATRASRTVALWADQWVEQRAARTVVPKAGSMVVTKASPVVGLTAGLSAGRTAGSRVSLMVDWRAAKWGPRPVEQKASH